MKKINIGELIVANYKQNEVIEWLDVTCAKIVSVLADAASANAIAQIGATATELSIVANVLHQMNEDVNGKKDKVVL